MIEMQQVSSQDTQQNPDYSDKVLFVIDDDDVILDMISSNLVSFGFRVENIHEFSSAVEAIEIIRFIKPDLIISDVHMPGLSGDSMAKLIQWPEFNNCPIIAITGDNEFCPGGLAATFIDAVVYKPIENQLLFSKISDLLQSSQQQLLAVESDRRDRAVKLNQSIQHKENGLRRAFGKTCQTSG